MNKSEFLTQIKALRRKQGFTQAELAEAANVSLKTISNLENGDFMGKNTISKVAGVLGVKITRYYIETFSIKAN